MTVDTLWTVERWGRFYVDLEIFVRILNKIYNTKLQCKIIKIFQNNYQSRVKHNIIGRVGVVSKEQRDNSTPTR